MIKTIFILAALGFSIPLMAESLANDILKRDTINGMGGVKMILAAKGQKCQPKLIDAKVLQQPTDLQYRNGVPVGGHWREQWTLQCNKKKVVVPIKFILDSTGASWAIRPDEIKFK